MVREGLLGRCRLRTKLKEVGAGALGRLETVFLAQETASTVVLEH